VDALEAQIDWSADEATFSGDLEDGWGVRGPCRGANATSCLLPDFVGWHIASGMFRALAHTAARTAWGSSAKASQTAVKLNGQCSSSGPSIQRRA
jgi:hypothetical protein